VLVRLFTPQLARGEAHGIDLLLLCAETLNIAVLKFLHVGIALDRPNFSAHVARQSRVSHGIYVSCAHALPCVKVCGGGELGTLIGNDPGGHFGDGEHMMSRSGPADRLSALDLGRGRHAGRYQDLGHKHMLWSSLQQGAC
jgi:hypothetical protein